jgi:hypothetical protein
MNVTTHCYGNTLAIRLAADATVTTSSQRSLSIAFLLDNSGSMEGDRIRSVKQTLHAARTLFCPEDRVTLVTFSRSAKVLLDHQLMTNDGVTAFYEAIDNIRPESTTNMGAGIEALFGCGRDYDTVILLTDGIVNGGIRSTTGLRAMALGAGGHIAFNALGYGSDHNRTLLRDLATRSRGTYTFVDSDEILPIAMADILSGVRTEVFRDVRVSPPAGWTCQEVGGERVGGIVPDRDYWVIFCATSLLTDDSAVVTVTAAGRPPVLSRVEPSRPIEEMPHEVTEQLFRTRVASVMIALSDQLEGQTRDVLSPFEALESLREDIDALPEVIRTRPLMLRLIGQIAEILSAESGAGAGSLVRMPRRTNLLARLASGATTLCNQRGVYNMSSTLSPTATTTAGDPLRQVSFFSSPTQRNASSTVHATYSQHSSDPAADEPQMA